MAAFPGVPRHRGSLSCLSSRSHCSTAFDPCVRRRTVVLVPGFNPQARVRLHALSWNGAGRPGGGRTVASTGESRAPQCSLRAGKPAGSRCHEDINLNSVASQCSRRQQDTASVTAPASPKTSSNQTTDSDGGNAPSPAPAPAETGSLQYPQDFLGQGQGQSQASRRLVLSAAGGGAIALGADFLGCTSSILSAVPEWARGARLDVLYPVQGFRRCLDSNKGFEFIYPASWLGDQRLVYRAVQRGEQQRSLDPQPLTLKRADSISSTGGGTGTAARPVEPLVAFGPAGGTGELNISVVVAHVDWGFRLERFGGASDVANRLLSNVIAPPGSNLEAVLLGASQEAKDGVLYYTFEFTVVGPTFNRHNMTVCCVHNSELYSLTAQAPDSAWKDVASSFLSSAQSFKVLPTK